MSALILLEEISGDYDGGYANADWKCALYRLPESDDYMAIVRESDSYRIVCQFTIDVGHQLHNAPIACALTFGAAIERLLDRQPVHEL